ncbi:sulfite exporter TauE/SafE family protein [Arenimonas sp.]|uniref:sulfite exporter TauE/SafE family protein n=1 Tax=Arenimonas sp. TaxID=1872635 RepID=UPI0039E4DD95
MPLEWLLYPLLGLVAGVLAGLLGVGGGLVLVAALAWLLPLQGVPTADAMHAALATSLASIIITSTASARAHHLRGSVLWPSVLWLLPGLLVGAWLGSRFASLLSGEFLRGFVAIYCLIAAAQLSLDWPRPRAEAVEAPRGAGLSFAGVFIGAIASLVGIGGGSMTVPLLVWRGVAPVRAVGTSSACGIGIGLASALGYATLAPAGTMPPGSLGYVFLPAAIGIALTSMLAAPYGTRLAHRLSGKALKRVFAAFLLAVALSLAI